MEFNEQQRRVHLAWDVEKQNTSDDIALWLEQLMQRCYQIHHDWKVNAFMVDDALDEISAFR